MQKMKRKKKILVVDDEPDIIDLIKIRLEADGYEVITASDGEAGLQKTKKEKPDLITLDIKMPKMDGYTFVRKMKIDEAIKDIPIIILSGKAEMKDLFRIEGIGDYLVKPFDPEQLLDLIKKYLN